MKNFERTVKPENYLENIDLIANEIVEVFEKYSINQYQAILVMSQVIGSIAIKEMDVQYGYKLRKDTKKN